jgi:TolB protein
MRRLGIIAAVALSATALSACGTTAPKAELRGHQGTVREIPWSLVDSKWTLAMWSPVKEATSAAAQHKATSLFVVDPVGGRYLVGHFAPASSLMTWSYSLHRAVLDSWTNAGETFITVDVTSGRVIARWHVGTDTVDHLAFFDAAGHTLLASVAPESNVSSPVLEQRNLSGRILKIFTSTFTPYGPLGGSFAASTNFELIAAAAGTVPSGVNFAPSVVVFYSSHAKVQRTVKLENLDRCAVLRWWNASSVLLECSSRSSYLRPSLYTVSTAGVTQTLTGEPAGNGLEGDVNGWKLTSGLYMQEVGYCGEYIVKYRSDNSRTVLKVPLVTGDETAALGATKSELLIMSTVGCGPGQSILWYNPQRGRSVIVLGSPLNGGSVVSALVNPRNATS